MLAKPNIFFKHFRSFFKHNKKSISTVPAFSKDTYNISRGNFNTLEERHIDFFKNLLGFQNILTEESDIESYNLDIYHYFRGSSSLVLKPKTTEQVSQILAYCNENVLAVCPQGGNTGIAGGATPVFDEIVISAENMDKIYEVDENSGILCQSGCILEKLDDYLSNYNLMLPLDLGSRGSCHIGGCVSTNAGGIRLFRYGNMHGNVLGLEAVTADGKVIDCLNTLKKDNTGYHLKHLFIGSEGTVGFVTKVAIQCPVKPKYKQLAFLGAQNFTKVLKLLKSAKEDLAEILSAVEVMDHESILLMKTHFDMVSPIGDYPFYLFVEVSGSNQEHDEEKLTKFFEKAMQSHFILNGTVVSSPAKCNELWKIREQVALTFVNEGFVFCYDISLPLKYCYSIVEEMKNYMGNKSHKVFGFGHLGDGNIHLQIAVDEYSSELKEFIEPYLFRRINELKGSISAEHGIGLMKKQYLPLVKTENTMFLMKNIKAMMDPNGILNPYKIL